MQTHDLPSRIFLSENFKKNDCKVFLGAADGCDELLVDNRYIEKYLKKNLI